MNALPSQSSSVEIAKSKSQPVRVCHVSMTLDTGGLERLLVEMSKHIDRRKLHFDFVSLCGESSPAVELRELGFDVTSLNFDGRGGKWSLFQQLKAHFLAGRYDVVHTHNTYPQFYAAPAARFAKVPVVINTQHGRGCGPGAKARWQFAIANRMTDCVVGVSEDATRLCQGQDQSAAAKMRCIWNGVDLNRFEYFGPVDDLRAVSVARLSKEKDFPTLIKAVSLVKDRQPEFRVTIVGDGQERADLERCAQELGVNDRISFAGEQSDIPSFLKQAGFFVSSSRTEGISLTLLEAMGVGLPILATAVGGNPEIVDDGRTGRLVPSEDPEALADAIDQMCRDQEMWKTMGELGRDRVERHFSLRNMIDRYASLYDEFLANSKRS